MFDLRFLFCHFKLAVRKRHVDDKFVSTSRVLTNIDTIIDSIDTQIAVFRPKFDNVTELTVFAYDICVRTMVTKQ